MEFTTWMVPAETELAQDPLRQFKIRNQPDYPDSI